MAQTVRRAVALEQLAGLPPWFRAERRRVRERVSPMRQETAVARPTFADAYAGCGGLSLGLMRAGWKGLFAIERDPFAFTTLSTNLLSGKHPFQYDWPDGIEKRAWEINDLLSQRRAALADLRGQIDLLAGGPPCQGFSDAGRRRRDDPRNRLFEAYLELVDILDPHFVLVENVRGFTADFSGSKREKITNFAGALRQGLSAKYNLEWSIIRACDFGVPQVRPRFFMVGAKKTGPGGGGIGAFFDQLRSQASAFLYERRLPQWPTARDAISDLETRRNGTVLSSDTAGFEAIAYKAPLTPYQKAMRAGHEGAPPDTRLARHQPEIRDRFAAIIKAGHEEGRLGTTVSPETREEFGLKKTAIRVLDPLSYAPTITSLPDDLLHYVEPRTLTVRETARLQTFPDWFAFKGNYTTGGHRRRKEVPRFTQVANAVPPLLAEQLGLVLLRLGFSRHLAQLNVDSVAQRDQRRLVFLQR